MSAPMTDAELDAIEAEAAALPGETWGLASSKWAPTLVAALRAERRKSAMLVADRGALVEERDLAARRAAEAERDLAVAREALDAERALRLREAAAHVAESVRWGTRKTELLERVVALEAQATGKQPTADVLAGELARAVARGGDAAFDATAEGVAYVVTVARRDAP